MMTRVAGVLSGLAFHQHEESWLALVSGQKHWCLRSHARGLPPPATAFKRVPLDELLTAEAPAVAAARGGARLQQVAGSCSHLPAETAASSLQRPNMPARPELDSSGGVCLVDTAGAAAAW